MDFANGFTLLGGNLPDMLNMKSEYTGLLSRVGRSGNMRKSENKRQGKRRGGDLVSSRPQQGTETPQAWSGLENSLTDRLSKIVMALQASFTQLNSRADPEIYGTVRIVYQSMIRELTPDQRFAFFSYILAQVKEAELDPEVLKVFIQSEPGHKIVNPAVHAYLRLTRARSEHPFVAAQSILEIISCENVANRGAVFAALVCFGDRRVCALARTVQETITVSEARAFALAVSCPLHIATFEFCLGWLVQVAKVGDFQLAIPISSAISVMVVKDSTRLLSDDEYNFGPYGFSSSVNHPAIRFKDLLAEFRPVLELLGGLGKPPLDQMIEILNDPGGVTVEQIKRQKIEVQRRILEQKPGRRPRSGSTHVTAPGSREPCH